jgi:hypothetical protein
MIRRDPAIQESGGRFAYAQREPLLTVHGPRVTLDSQAVLGERHLVRFSQAVEDVPVRGEFFDGFVSEAIYSRFFFEFIRSFFSRSCFRRSNSEHRIPTASQRLRSGLD